MSFDEVYLDGVTEDVGTLQFGLTMTLSPSDFELHGLVDGEGTYSATYYSNGQLSCSGTGSYKSSVSGQTSFENGTVSFGNFGVGRFTYSSTCIDDATHNIIYDLIDSCFGNNSPSDPTNAACAGFPVQGGSNTITKNPSFSSYTESYRSITGTAQLTLVSSTSTTSTTSLTSSTTSSTTSTTSTTATSTPPDCNLDGFALQLFGVRSIQSTTYTTRVNDTDTFFIDGKFFQPALPPQTTIGVRVTVTITGADDVPVNYGAPVTGSLGAQPTPDVPTTWVTLAPPSAPLKRPLGLWQAIATAQITLLNPTCSAEIGPIFSNVVPFLVQSMVPSLQMQTKFPNGTVIPIPVYGNVTAVTPASVVNTNGLYTLKFNATGPTNSAGSMTIVVAKNLVPTRWTPAVIVNGMRIPVSYQTPQLVKQCFPVCYVAGFSQDDDNYYIRVNMHFSTNAVEVDLVPPQFSNGQSAALVLGQPDMASKGYYVCQYCLAAPHGVALDSLGNLWVADAASNRVVRFSPPLSNGINASLVVGHPNFTVSGASTSQNGLRAPIAVVFDSSGDLWVSDAGNNRVLEFKPPFSSGMSASLVLGQSNFTGLAHSTTGTGLWAPTGMTFDPTGNLWVADYANSRVLRFAPPFSNGMVASVVIGQRDYTSRSFVATQDGLNGPTGVAFDTAGNMWVADSFNNRTLEFMAPFKNGMNASLVVGQSSFTASTTCAASQSTVCSPAGVSFDTWGNLWVTDAQDNRVMEFSPPFSTGMSATSVLGQPDFTSVAEATSATALSLRATGISMTNAAFDQSGNLWIGDTSNNRVVELTSKNSPASVIPEFPPLVGTSGLMLTWLVVLAIVGAIAVSNGRRRLNHAPRLRGIG